MSVWTHVAGIIRIDSIRMEGADAFPTMQEKLKRNNCLGKQVDFEDDWDKYDRKTNPIPWGSEGSVKYKLIENIRPGDDPYYELAAYQVVIWGDLRDYDDAQAVIDWFKNALTQLYVRQAVITVEVEYGETLTYTYTEGEEK